MSDDYAAGPWRVGSHYNIHVYAGERPVATFHNPADARAAVELVNRALAAAPPPPVPAQAESGERDPADARLPADIPAWKENIAALAVESLREQRDAAEAKCREMEGEVARISKLHNIELARNCNRDAPDYEARLLRAAQAARGVLDAIWQLSNRGLSRAAARAQLAQINDIARAALASLASVLDGGEE